MRISELKLLVNVAGSIVTLIFHKQFPFWIEKTTKLYKD